MTEERSLARAVVRLREQGLVWVLRRLAFELVTPTTAPGHALFRLRAAAGHALHRVRRRGAVRHPDAANLLYAFYDLAVAPVTYDCLWFLVGAEQQRLREGRSGIHVVIVPGDHQGLRREEDAYEQAVDVEARRMRILNLLMPAFTLLPSVRGITLAPSRAGVAALFDQAEAVFPRHYSLSLPSFVRPQAVMSAGERGEPCQVLEAPAEARRAIERWCTVVAGRRRIVTITLRDYAFGTERNSNVAVWQAFARSLDPMEWCVVVLADTSQTFDPLPNELRDFPFLHAASWNVLLRAALYEMAYLNLGVNSGPMMYPLFSRARGLMFRLITPDVPQGSAAYLRALGFSIGGQPPGAHPFYRWVWEDEAPETIRRAFDVMTAQIERQCGPPKPPCG